MDLELKLYECREYDSIDDYVEPSISDLLRQPKVVDFITKEAGKGNGCTKTTKIIKEKFGINTKPSTINNIMRERGIKVVTKQDILEDQYNSVIKLKNSGKTYNEIVEIFSKKYNRRFAEDDIKLFFCKQKTKK